MPAGMARIEVRFLIDANGILNVTARDQRTGKEHSVEVKPSYGLTDEQVEKMILESFEKAEARFRARARCAKRAWKPTRFWRAVEKARQQRRLLRADRRGARGDRQAPSTSCCWCITRTIIILIRDEDRAAEPGDA